MVITAPAVMAAISSLSGEAFTTAAGNAIADGFFVAMGGIGAYEIYNKVKVSFWEQAVNRTY